MGCLFHHACKTKFSTIFRLWRFAFRADRLTLLWLWQSVTPFVPRCLDGQIVQQIWCHDWILYSILGLRHHIRWWHFLFVLLNRHLKNTGMYAWSIRISSSVRSRAYTISMSPITFLRSIRKVWRSSIWQNAFYKKPPFYSVRIGKPMTHSYTGFCFQFFLIIFLLGFRRNVGLRETEKKFVPFTVHMTIQLSLSLTTDNDLLVICLYVF